MMMTKRLGCSIVMTTKRILPVMRQVKVDRIKSTAMPEAAHLRAGLRSPSGSSSSSNGQESDHSGSSPVAARTRSKLKT